MVGDAYLICFLGERDSFDFGGRHGRRSGRELRVSSGRSGLRCRRRGELDLGERLRP
jgi:hypothetical protein